MVFSARSVFLSIYTSNAFIKYTFIPLCTLFFYSPLLLLLARVIGIRSTPLSLLPEHWTAPAVLPQLFLALLAILLSTRLLSGNASGALERDGKARKVPSLPYFVPILRHWVQFLWNGEGLLRSVRDSSIHSIVAYKLAGTKHNVVLSPSLLEEILSQSDALASSDLSSWIIPHNVFGIPEEVRSQYVDLRSSSSTAVEDAIFTDPQFQEVIASCIALLETNLPDLITFNTSIVDQMQWERVSGVELTEGTSEVEVDLFALLNEFVCATILPPMAGAQFPESYQLLASDLLTINQSFFFLASGFPRWFPIPGLPAAHLARKRLLENFTKYFQDMSTPVKEKTQSPEEDDDEDTATPLSKLNALFSTYNISIPARASIAIELLHRLVSATVPLAFWAIIQIYSSPGAAMSSDTASESQDSLLQQLRAETKSWAAAIQPPSIHPLFPSPPQIKFTSSPKDTLNSAKHPLLGSCVKECQRMYSTPLTSRTVTKDTVITEKGTMGSASWSLKKDELIDIGISVQLQNTSPANYIDPQKWKADRFMNAPTEYLNDAPEDALVTSLVTVLVAGLTQLWDVRPKKGEGIKVPYSKPGRDFAWPGSDIRVKIARRELPEKEGK